MVRSAKFSTTVNNGFAVGYNDSTGNIIQLVILKMRRRYKTYVMYARE
jgi:hypothetical protein